MEASSVTRLFFLLCTSWACAAVEYLPNTVLSGYDVSVWKTLNQFQCASLCVKADICLSVNFHPASAECELNNHVIDEDHPGTPTRGYIYIAPNKSEEALSCGGLCFMDELCTHLDSETTACLPMDEGGDGTSTVTTGGDGTSTVTTSGDGTSTVTTGRDGTSTFARGGDGTSTFATGGDGTSTFATGGDGTSRFTTGGDGTSTFATGGDGTSTFATGGDGTSRFTTGGDGTSTFKTGGDGTSTFATGEDGTSTFAKVTDGSFQILQAQDVAATETTTHAQEIKLEAEHITVYEGRLTWSQANSFCHKYNQTLVSMKTMRKLKTLTENLPGRLQDLNIKPTIWSGLRRYEPRIYRWADCAPLGSWTHWNLTVDPDLSSDDCVTINGQNLEWFPSDCNNLNYFACEQELDSCWFKRYRNVVLNPLLDTESSTSQDECRDFCLDKLIQGEECIAYTYKGKSCFFLMGSDLMVDPPEVTCSSGSTTDVKKCFRYTYEPRLEANQSDELPTCKNKVDSPGSFTINGTFVHPACT